MSYGQACAIEEELLHISAPSRLDYFKSGFEFENRVKLKKDQLQGQLAALDAKRRAGGAGSVGGGQSSHSSSQASQPPALSAGVGGQASSGDATYKKQRI